MCGVGYEQVQCFLPCLPAYLPACLPACLPVSGLWSLLLPSSLSNIQCVPCLPVSGLWWSLLLPSSISKSLVSGLCFFHSVSAIHNVFPACLPACLPAGLPACLPPACLPACLPVSGLWSLLLPSSLSNNTQCFSCPPACLPVAVSIW